MFQNLLFSLAFIAIYSTASAEDVVAPAEQPEQYNAVKLQILNKVAARVVTINVPLGVETRHSTLEIVARSCHKSAAGEKPENSSLLEISEVKTDGANALIFNGWMFSSSPALSALENPVYDVIVMECTAL